MIWKTKIGAAIIILFSILSTPAWAVDSEIGTVIFTCGVVTAGPEEGETRILGKGSPLYEEDIITTGQKSFVIIKMIDDAKLTIRPDTVFGLEEYVHEDGKKSAVLRLFRGGLRAVMGLIAKLNPDKGYRLHTPMAVVGVRGTEFDARICEEDCAEEGEKLESAQAKSISPVVGRVVRLRGRLSARKEDGTLQRLVKGGPVYEGDTLEIDKKGFAVVVFRDESRVTLHWNAKFKVEHYKYRETEKPSIFLRLFHGGLRVFTGLLAHKDAQVFKVGIPTATIGVRGTGFDLFYGKDLERGRQIRSDGRLATKSEGMFFHVWDGTIEVKPEVGRPLILAQNQAAFMSVGGEPALLKAIPMFMRDILAPRPDKVEVDMKNLFGSVDQKEARSGLYVTVYDGHVTLENEAGVIELGKGEAAYADPAQRELFRLEQPPIFQLQDRFPRPELFDENKQRILDFIVDEFGSPSEEKELECEIR